MTTKEAPSEVDSFVMLNREESMLSTGEESFGQLNEPVVANYEQKENDQPDNPDPTETNPTEQSTDGPSLDSIASMSLSSVANPEPITELCEKLKALQTGFDEKKAELQRRTDKYEEERSQMAARQKELEEELRTANELASTKAKQLDECKEQLESVKNTVTTLDAQRTELEIQLKELRLQNQVEKDAKMQSLNSVTNEVISLNDDGESMIQSVPVEVCCFLCDKEYDKDLLVHHPICDKYFCKQCVQNKMFNKQQRRFCPLCYEFNEGNVKSEDNEQKNESADSSKTGLTEEEQQLLLYSTDKVSCQMQLSTSSFEPTSELAVSELDVMDGLNDVSSLRAELGSVNAVLIDLHNVFKDDVVVEGGLVPAVKRLKGQLDSSLERMMELELTLAKQERAFDELSQELRVERERSEGLMKVAKEKEEKLTTFTEKTAVLEAALEKKRSDIETLNKSVEGISATLAQTERDNKNLQAQDRDTAELERRLMEIEQELESERAKNTLLQNDFAAGMQERDNLRVQFRSIEEQLVARNKELEKSESELAAALEQVNDLKGQHIDTGEQLAVCKKELDEEPDESQSQLAAALRQIDDLKDQYADIEQQLEARDNELNDCQNKLTDALQQIDHWKHQRVTTVEPLMSPDQDEEKILDKVQSNMMANCQQDGDLEYQHEDVEEQLEAHRNEPNQELDESQRELTVALQQLANVKNQYADLENQLALRDKELDDCLKQVDDLKRRLQEAEETSGNDEQNRQLVEQLQDQMNFTESLAAERKELIEHLNTTNTDLHKLRSEYKASLDNVQQLKRKLEDIAAKFERTTEALNTANAQLHQVRLDYEAENEHLQFQLHNTKSAETTLIQEVAKLKDQVEQMANERANLLARLDADERQLGFNETFNQYRYPMQQGTGGGDPDRHQFNPNYNNSPHWATTPIGSDEFEQATPTAPAPSSSTGKQYQCPCGHRFNTEKELFTHYSRCTQLVN